MTKLNTRHNFSIKPSSQTGCNSNLCVTRFKISLKSFLNSLDIVLFMLLKLELENSELNSKSFQKN